MSFKVNEVSQKEIYWLLSGCNVGSQANVVMSRITGPDSSYFAKVNVGGRDFVWEAPDEGWISRSAASAEVGQIIEQQWQDLCARISKSANNPKIVEQLLTLPNSDYIFFKQDPQGDVSILVTGWGFKNFKPSSQNPISEPIHMDSKHSARIGFTQDGVLIPHRAFHIKAPQLLVPQKTGPDGYFLLGEHLEVGRIFEISDDVSGKSFQVQVVDNKEYYDLDVTEFTTIEVYVTQDGAPVKGKMCRIQYRGNEYYAETDNYGCAPKEVVLERDASCEVSVEGQYQRQTIVPEGCKFCFDLVTPKQEPIPESPQEKPAPEEPIVHTYDKSPISITLLDAEGKPQIGYQIELEQGSRQLSLILDESGMTNFAREEISIPGQVNVRIKGREYVPPIQLSLEEDEDKYVIQEQIEEERGVNWVEILLGVVAIVVVVVIGYLLFHFAIK